MKIDIKAINMELARQCKTMSDLRGNGLSPQTLVRVRKGVDVKPITVGRIAKALGVDPAEIIDKED